MKTHGINKYGARQSARAFTLLEMLVVVGIIALIVSIGLPGIANMGKAQGMTVAQRQLLDTFTYARHLALNSRSSVYVVFAPGPPFITDTNSNFTLDTNSLTMSDYRLVNTLVAGQYGSYAVYAQRTVGEQPGQSHPRYLTDWERLPQGIFINPADLANTNIFQQARVLFPTTYSTNMLGGGLNRVYLPFVGFDGQGQVIGKKDINIPLMEGSLIVPRNPDGTVPYQDFGPLVVETRAPEQSIIPGITYTVRSGTGDITYNGGVVAAGQHFVGVAAATNFTISANNPRVSLFEGVNVNWLTGRGKVIRPTL